MKKKSAKNKTQSATRWGALTVELQGGEQPWLQILPDGEFSAVDGRPDDVPSGKWIITPQSAQRLIDGVAARKNPLVVDYEHQTLNSELNGQPAPAAGWFHEVKYTPDQGVFILPTWTDRARGFIQNGEYRYLSAVFAYDPETGEIDELHSVGLTNTPGLDGLQAVEALRSKQSHQEKPKMNELLEQLLTQLGITVSGDQPNEQESQAALSALAELATTAATAAAAQTELATLKAKGTADIDLSKWVPAETYQAVVHEMAQLKGQTNQETATRLIDDARREGRVLAAEEKYLGDYANQNGVAALKALISQRPAVAALSGQAAPQVPDTKPPSGAGAHGLTDAELTAARITGKTAEEYAALKAK